MGFIYETKISDLPIDIQKSIQKMETDFGLDITDDHKNDPKYKGKVECTDSNSYDHSPIFMNFYNKFGSRI